MIELKEGQLWIYIHVKRRGTTNVWNWAYQVGEDKRENFTGSANSKRSAIRRAKKAVKTFMKSQIVVQTFAEEIDHGL